MKSIKKYQEGGNVRYMKYKKTEKEAGRKPMSRKAFRLSKRGGKQSEVADMYPPRPEIRKERREKRRGEREERRGARYTERKEKLDKRLPSFRSPYIDKVKLARKRLRLDKRFLDKVPEDILDEKTKLESFRRLQQAKTDIPEKGFTTRRGIRRFSRRQRGLTEPLSETLFKGQVSDEAFAEQYPGWETMSEDEKNNIRSEAYMGAKEMGLLEELPLNIEGMGKAQQARLVTAAQRQLEKSRRKEKWAREGKPQRGKDYLKMLGAVVFPGATAGISKYRGKRYEADPTSVKDAPLFTPKRIQTSSYNPYYNQYLQSLQGNQQGTQQGTQTQQNKKTIKKPYINIYRPYSKDPK